MSPSKYSTKLKYSLVIENLSSVNVEKFKYLGITVTDTNGIHKEIKHRINMGNACYYSLEKILLSYQLTKKLKVNTYKLLYYQLYCMVMKLGLSS